MTTTTATRTYKIDKSHSEAIFQVRHLVTKVRGRFTDFEGAIEFNEANPEQSSVHFTINTTSIDTAEPDRDKHLRSADFFEIESYPTLSFTSTGFRAGSGNSFELDGDLTVKGETNPVTLKGEFLGWGPGMQGGTLASFSASTTIDREDFDLTWNVAVETGGWLVGKKVDIVIDADLVLED